MCWGTAKKIFNYIGSPRVKISQNFLGLLFSERDIGRPSVCRLSVVCLFITFVHPTQAIEILGNVSIPFGTLVICSHPGKPLRS